MKRLLLVAVCALTLSACQTINLNPEPAGQAGASSAAAAQKAAAEKEDDPFEPWDETLEDTEEIEGFITLHRKRDGTLYAELPPEQLGEDFGMMMHISQGAGVFNLHDGLYLSGTRLMRFRRVGDAIHLVHRNARFTADDGSPMQYSLEGNTAHSVVGAFDIESRNEETKHVLVDVTGFFASDYAGIGEQIKFYFNQKPAQFDKAKSHVAQVMGFPENVEIDAALTYKGAEAPSYGGAAIPDYRAIPVGVRYSLFALPEEPMQPRWADDRVGYFTTAMKDFSRDQQADPYLRYVQRWRLEPSDAGAAAQGERVEPEEPIVYYIDRSVPEEYRPYVRQGIEAWNKAFEAAGYENAVVAKEAPDDSTWSAEDVRYSTVRWTAAHQMGYAIGPSQVDPRTGEILNADILISSTFVRGWASEFQELTPEAMTSGLHPGEELRRTMPPQLAGRLCIAERGKAHQLGLQRAVLAGRGLLGSDGAMPEEFLGSAIRDLVMHEVGHTLGLRHNFKASSAIPHERLNDEAYTREHGLSLSVMDYAPVNIAVDADAQGHYWNQEVGSYDEWAITYGYTPLPNEAASPEAQRPALAEIARQGSDPLHTYATDEDTHLGPYAVDPLSNTWELGSDPLQFAADRAALVRKVGPLMDERLIDEGERYHRLREATTGLIFERYIALLPVTKMVGGMYMVRDHKGDPGARAPFTPVPAERQRAAVQLLIEEAFAAGAFEFDAERLNKLAPDRHRHWGSGWSLQLAFPAHAYVGSVQQGLLNNLLHPARLQRMADGALHVPSGEDTYRPSELLQTLTGAIWSDLDAGSSTDSFRRNLQRAYTDHLIRLMLEVSGGPQEIAVPEHVRSLARLELTTLSEDIARALGGGGLDRDTQAHLAETKARIDRALDASLTETF